MLNVNIDLTGVDTSMPVLCAGLYRLVIAEIDVKENKKKTGNNLVVTFKTVDPATSTKGNTEGVENDIKPGFPIKKWYQLQQSDNPDAPDFKLDLARLQEAALGSTGPFNTDELLNKEVLGTVTVEDSEEYGMSNNIKRLARPAE